MFLTLLFIVVHTLAFVTITSAQMSDDMVYKNLAGEYNLVDVKSLLNITDDSPPIGEICPPKLTLVRSDDTTNFDLDFLSSIPNQHCDTRKNDTINLTFNRGKPSTRILSTRILSTSVVVREKVSFDTVAETYPILFAFSVSQEIMCPNNIPVGPTIIAQDTGLWFTLLNHYKNTEDPLGTIINATDPDNVSDVRHKYILSMPIATPDVQLGCTYLQPDEETEMREMLKSINDNMSSDNSTHEDDACFPSMAKVQLANGQLVPMNKLRIGDSVRDSSDTTSKVILFTHADPNAISEFVIIHTDSAQIALSPSHYIYRGHHLVPAHQIRVGDKVTVVTHRKRMAEARKVVKVETQVLRGLYNPQTTSGSIVVSWRGHGVLSSTYTTTITPMAAHALLGPLRILEAFFSFFVVRWSSVFGFAHRDIVQPTGALRFLSSIFDSAPRGMAANLIFAGGRFLKA